MTKGTRIPNFIHFGNQKASMANSISIFSECFSEANINALKAINYCKVCDPYVIPGRILKYVQ
jgi:hypothetical protein